MTQKSCAVGMRNAKPGNHLNKVDTSEGLPCKMEPSCRKNLLRVMSKRNYLNCLHKHFKNAELTTTALCRLLTREFKQITTVMAGATTAATTKKIWGEYVPVVCQVKQSEIQRCQKRD